MFNKVYGVDVQPWKANSRKYRRIFEVHSQKKLRRVREKNWSQQVETYASPTWDETRCPEKYASPVSMLNPSQMFYGNLS